jgi:hypothetical protein
MSRHTFGHWRDEALKSTKEVLEGIAVHFLDLFYNKTDRAWLYARDSCFDRSSHFSTRKYLVRERNKCSRVQIHFTAWHQCDSNISPKNLSMSEKFIIKQGHAMLSHDLMSLETSIKLQPSRLISSCCCFKVYCVNILHKVVSIINHSKSSTWRKLLQ